MTSQGADANDASNFPFTIPELLKILPKRETNLEICMGNSSEPTFGSNNLNSNHTSNRKGNSLAGASSSSLSLQQNNPSYHTLRYDFKPASINSEEPASLELTPTGQVTIKAPNVAGSLSSQTVFRGQRRPHVKECLLVIDNSTGEMVLQKLTDNITVKATRGLGGGTGSGGGGGTSSGGVPGPGPNANPSSAPANQVPGSSGTPISTTTTSNNHLTTPKLPISRNDGPQLSEDSSSSSDSSSDSSSSSSSSSSNSGNSSPNNEGFTF